jgi:hypothetical protein
MICILIGYYFYNIVIPGITFYFFTLHKDNASIHQVLMILICSTTTDNPKINKVKDIFIVVGDALIVNSQLNHIGHVTTMVHVLYFAYIVFIKMFNN